MSMDILLPLYISNSITINNISNGILVAILKYERRRKRRLHAFLKLLDQKSSRVWSYPKNLTWWQSIVPKFTDSQWKANFRVEKTTYALILHKVKGFVQKRDTNYRKCIPVEKRVAVCLYMLTSSSELRTVSQLFGIEKSSLCRMLHEFCQCIVSCLMKHEIVMPTTEPEITTLMKDFQTNYHFPQCFGAVDGTHIAVSPPKVQASDFFNYKCFYSIVLLAVCDSNYKFWYINVDNPGRNNDAFIYKSSKLFNYLQDASSKFEYCSATFNKHLVPPLVLGDAAFPLQNNLIKPFPGINLSPVQTVFNQRQEGARKVIETAFQRLKGRFQIIRKKNEFKIKNVPNIIKACCILHNICEKQNDVPHEAWLDDVVLIGDSTVTTVGNCNEDAMTVRQSLANHFNA